MTEMNPEAASARMNMVENQVRPNQVSDPRIVNAMRTLPRAAFAPAGARVYADADISLGGGRYLLAPMLIGRLTQAVMAENPERVLVIGAGAGYGAAILAAAGAEVVALESEPRLRTAAPMHERISEVTGPLAAGHKAGGPYDAILIEGAVPEIPAGLAAQLVAGGKLVTILGDAGGRLGCIVVGQASGGTFAVVKLFDCGAKLLPEFAAAPAFVF